MAACLRHSGVIQTFQPASQLETFRLIEAVIFVVLAALLGAVTWFRVRRTDI